MFLRARCFSCLLLLVGLLPTAAARADFVVFSDDFDGGQSSSFGVNGSLSGVTTTESVQGYAGLGNGSNQFGGDFLRNATGGLPNIGDSGALTTLTLTNLPTHTSISLRFLLATIDSWDGVDGKPIIATGDYFNVRVDGVEVFEASFAQLSGTRAAAYQAPVGGELSHSTDLFGFFSNDGAYDMGLESALSNIAHTSSTLTIDFFADGPGWQGGRDFSSGIQQSDESWAIDNLSVSLNAIPEPSAGLLMLAGMALIPALRLRRI